jgi:predicted transcriptional regulator
MLEKTKVIVDVLDIFVSLKRGLHLTDVNFQLNNIYETQGKKVDQHMLIEIINELTADGYLKTFKVGALDSWKITEEGEDYFYDL